MYLEMIKFDIPERENMFSEKCEQILTGVRKGLQSKPSLDWSNPVTLVANYADPEIRAEVIEKATQTRRQNWQEQLFLMPPFYISNDCMDRCLYCPFGKDLPPSELLSSLDPKQVKTGIEDLLKQGYQDVELVSATTKRLLDGDQAAEYISATKEAGASHIGVNFMPGPTEEYYRRIADAGCDFVIVWQETYNPDVYLRMHPKGSPKHSLKYRLDAHDRAALGGIKTFGGAFLGRLPGTDWREESLMTLSHMQYLIETYGNQVDIIFGMPRWIRTPNIPLQANPSDYTDQAYEFVGALYSLFMPRGLVWFSTREEFKLSAQAAKGGGCLFTLDCSTEVDGYRKSGYAQFPVHSMNIEQGIPWLQTQGYDPRTSLPWVVSS